MTVRQTGNDELFVRTILDPLEFISFDSQGNLMFMIGDTSDISTSICPQNTTLAMGRLMFTEFGLVIRAHSTGKYEIGLYRLPTEGHIFLVMTCLLFMQLLVIMLSLLVLKTCKRNGREYIEERYKLIIEEFNKQQTVLRKTAGRLRSTDSLLPKIHEPRFN